jgi:hypothetical protein
MTLTKETKKHIKQRSSYYWNKYGLNEDNIEDMFIECKMACQICKKPFTSDGVNKCNVDHCHKTEKIRGLLCTRCNTGLGFFEDNPYTLLSAIRYVLKHADLKTFNEMKVGS